MRRDEIAARVLTGGRSHDLGRYDSIVGAAGAFESYSLSRVGLAPARAVVVRLAR